MANKSSTASSEGFTAAPEKYCKRPSLDSENEKKAPSRMKMEPKNQNMVSNLPLVFAGGYPTALFKMTEENLQKFIPFMVQCSLGQPPVVGSSLVNRHEPEWWPETIPYVIPLRKPENHRGIWRDSLMSIVVTCYTFHKCMFLLKFCEKLSKYKPARMRFINNYNSTTSLFDRTNNKLLVTFRNENMLYDQNTATNHKKTLLKRSHTSISKYDQQMVEPAVFDIYLCDNCEAELYSLDAYTDHERYCNSTNDTDEIVISDSDDEDVSDTTKQASFLHNFCLNRRDELPQNPSPKKVPPQSLQVPSHNVRKQPRRARGVNLGRCQAIPISSPAGQVLIKTGQFNVTNEYIMERLERCERFCAASSISNCKTTDWPKFMVKPRSTPNVSVTFKKYQAVPCIRKRSQIMSKRTIGRHNPQQIILNDILMKAMKPCRVYLKRFTDKEYEKALESDRESKQSNSPIVFEDIVDLCSSDDEDPLSPFDPVDSAFDSGSPSNAESCAEDSLFSANVQNQRQPLQYVVSKHIPVKSDTLTVTPNGMLHRHIDKQNQENEVRLINRSSTNLAFPSKVPAICVKFSYVDLT